MAWRHFERSALALVLSLVGGIAAAQQPAPVCAPGSTCIRVQALGKKSLTGQSVARCTGRYADSIDPPPRNYPGPFFKLSQDYPTELPHDVAPWLAIDFKTQPDAYLLAIRDYAFEGMRDANWRAEANTVRRWYHVPWMTAGARGRESLYGMTEERGVTGPELGVKPGRTIQNYAVGYYNPVGGYTLGKVWLPAAAPDLSSPGFAEGTAVVKILASDATAGDFSGPDLLAGSPSFTINRIDRQTKKRGAGKVRLLQVDVAVRDERAQPAGWVFGTFAYDRGAPGSDAWKKMVPVGLTWGNDPRLAAAEYAQGERVKESVISQAAPTYAREHLGWRGRLNGPVDNPASSCMSCHSTAQSSNAAPILPLALCRTDAQKMQWFRNLKGTAAFGRVSGTCVRTDDPSLKGLDFSLQQAIAVQNARGGKYVNPCAPAAPVGFSPPPKAVPPEPAPKSGPQPQGAKVPPAEPASPPEGYPITR